MNLRILLCAVAICASSALAAQEPIQTTDNPIPKLRAAETVVTSEARSALIGPSRCDEEGNVYARMDQGGQGLRSPVVKFNAEGTRQAIFKLDGVPDLESMRGFGQFSVTPNGDLYQLAWTADTIFVMRFGKDGGFKSAIELGERVSPLQIVVFGSGTMLISGQTPQTKDDPGHPFTGIFDSGGKLLKEFSLPDEGALREAVNSGDAAVTGPRGNNRVVQLSEAVGAKDGNAYLLRWTSPARVYAISPAGEVVRSFTVDSGEAELMPGGMQVSGSYLTLMFRSNERKEAVFKVLDLTSGEEIATYTGERLGSALGCYVAPHRFTFFTTKEQRMAWIHAEP